MCDGFEPLGDVIGRLLAGLTTGGLKVCEVAVAPEHAAGRIRHRREGGGWEREKAGAFAPPARWRVSRQSSGPMLREEKNQQPTCRRECGAPAG